LPYLLNLIYLLLITVSLPWLILESVRKGKYREGYAAKFLGLVPRRRSNKKCVWLHAVSVGEVNLLAPLLKRIKESQPNWECVISTTTTTGMALARKKYAGYSVFYCPLDFSWATAAAMRRIRPDVLVLAELEIWPNLIWAAKRSGARVAVINGRLSEHSFRGYCRIRPLVARLMRQIDWIAAQDNTYAERFRYLGAPADAVSATGSMKYDGAQTDRNNANTRRLASLAGISADDMVLLAGSTQEPEEAMALDTFRQLSREWPQLRLILVPRHPDRFEAVAKLLESSGLAWQRRTQLADAARTDSDATQGNQLAAKAPDVSTHPASPLSPPCPRILLVDVVGELGAWWGTAQIAFVGGSMGRRGGQNVIEPAAYGAAVSFGPNTWNFRDIVSAILAHDAAVVVNDEQQFGQFVRRCLEQPDFAAGLGQRAQAFVRSQFGATERTLDLLADTLRSN
jgi:3-deoxy-D-manno-octulosonic-acid transferase